MKGILTVVHRLIMLINLIINYTLLFVNCYLFINYLFRSSEEERRFDKKKLINLHLDRNNLTRVKMIKKFLNQFTILENNFITVSGNQWHCDCQDVQIMAVSIVIVGK